MNTGEKRSVDIIIPVYNAYEDLKICLESVKKYTDLSKHRVILINDNSSDQNILPYLDNQADDRVLVFHNKENRGFSANINLGMRQSEENDVILLNSDTVVTANWVEKMLVCAYSSDGIGTVTPLSNNATLCSVPNFCQENQLPEYLSIDDAAAIVERYSFNDYPRITVAHGFCMLVKREVIKKIGGFDAETFQSGYGEENDFCNRAEQMGYVHVMCDNTYIYHSGTKSFTSKEKEKLIREHEQILEKRYPVQMHNNAVHCRDNPNEYIGQNVGLFFALKNGKKNILYVLHSDFKKGKNDNIGGTQFHVQDLKDSFCRKYNVYVLSRNGEYLCLTAYVGEKQYEFNFYVGKPDEFFCNTNRELRKVFENILESFEIHLIHVHNVVGLSFDIFYLAEEKKIPVVLAAHDYFYVCPTIRLLSADGVNCCGEPDSEQCQNCLRRTNGIIEHLNYVKDWRMRTADILKTCEKIFVPSQSVKEIYVSAFPQLRERLLVIEHGVHQDDEPVRMHRTEILREEFTFGFERAKSDGSNDTFEGWVNIPQTQAADERVCLQVKYAKETDLLIPVTLSSIDYANGLSARFTGILPGTLKYSGKMSVRPVILSAGQLYYGKSKPADIVYAASQKKFKLRVAFIGGLDISKGSSAICDIISNGAKDVQWFTFGTIGDLKLQNLKRDNYTAIGSYHPKDLPALLALHQIDLIGILSICPETYSYTLSEAILNQKPVIVTDLGALGERVKKYNCGYTVSVENTAKEFMQIIDNLKEDKAAYEVLQKRAAAIKLRSVKEMANDYEKQYEDILRMNQIKRTGEFNRRMIYSAYSEAVGAAGETGLRLSDKNIEYKLREAEEYRILKSTLTYQIIMKLINMRMPFKKQMMDWAYKHLRKGN